MHKITHEIKITADITKGNGIDFVVDNYDEILLIGLLPLGDVHILFIF